MPDIQPLPREIVLLEQAAAFLAECQDLDEVKSLIDQAEVIRLYQKKIGDSLRAQNAAGEIKLLAQHRMGELLREMTKHNGDPRSHDATRLSDLGITKSESSRTQAIAAIPEPKFKQHIAEIKESNRELTSKEMVRLGQAEQRRGRKYADLAARAAASNGQPVDWDILQAECIEALARLAPACPRLVATDPPYNEGIDYGEHYNDLRPRDAYLSWCGEWIEAVVRVLAADGSLWVLINDEFAAEFKLMLEAAGLHLRRWIIWFESFGVYNSAERNFGRTHRHLLYAVRDPRRFVFNGPDPEIRRESDRQAKYTDPRANPDGRVWGDTWGIDPPIPRLTATCEERLPDFPTQLPLALLRPIVACASNPGDLVVDPFSGSGTTGAACIELGRRFIGIELSEEYARLSRLRLAGVRPA
jgi:site-specific DNA-methyltransferase (adenine-specific)